MLAFLGSLLVRLGLLNAECSNELFVKLNVLDGPCLKLLVSKGLSMVIILGAFLLKVPQIRALLKARSSEGLTFTMFASETFVFALSAVFGLRSNFPLSTYLENWVVLAQVVVICLLILHYQKKTFSSALYVAALASGLFYLINVAPMSTVNLAYSAVIPILIYGRAPQIYSNWKRKNTGPLSLATLLMSFAGGLARVFTSLQEAPAFLPLVGLAIGLSLTLILIVQIFMYGGSKKSTATANKVNKPKKA